MEAILYKQRVQRVRHEIKQREVEVVSVNPIGANFISITFKGDTLHDFVSDSFDDHVKFIFVDPNGERVRRDYTPRSFDRAKQELTIEFAFHGDGQASEWARQATVGQRAVIAGPRGSMIIPVDYDWHFLAGDATALPAIHRRLEELPATARVTVVAQVADAADRREFIGDPQLKVHWVSTAQELVAAVQAIQLPQGDGFAWCAGEASVMVQLRNVLSVEKGLPKEAMRVAAYWKHGASEHHQMLD
ncbi:siderophore-interacting protein [Noviherbaspirillum saxi]|uniref:Siderophore-interacting protein n=1 Tax=Noviherbaspirillum saxi TaxID=2320863 RepID=A0A3A3FHL4_9BURK|nr:siderophore-interacting protein [Noviherbaspirillum saxi]RJF92650.1 siderophore-interacting protein [Noviherbaspirillum saxi]